LLDYRRFLYECELMGFLLRYSQHHWGTINDTMFYVSFLLRIACCGMIDSEPREQFSKSHPIHL
jgi:hypothetical protein